MTDHTVNPAVTGRNPKSVAEELREEIAVVMGKEGLFFILTMLVCGTVLVMLLVGLVGLTNLFVEPAAYD